MISPSEGFRLTASLLCVLFLLSVLWARSTIIQLRVDLNSLLNANDAVASHNNSTHAALEQELRGLRETIDAETKRASAGDVADDRPTAVDVRRVAVALHALQSRIDRLESKSTSMGERQEGASSAAASLDALRRELDKATTDLGVRIANVRDTEAAHLRSVNEQLSALREQLARLKQSSASHDESAPKRDGASGNATVAHAAPVAAARATWLSPLERAKSIGALTARVYDGRASFDDKLELLDDVHRLLDRLIADCGCSQDHASNHALQRRVYLNISMSLKPGVVCETGFGAGHGAAAFLLGARTRSEYIGFDLFARDYTRKAVAVLQDLFTSSLITVLEGSSGVNLAKHFEKIDMHAFKNNVPKTFCELSHVDGGRFAGVPLKDLRELHKHAAENSIVIMDDAACRAGNQHICSEPGKAWHRMKLEAKIFEERCYAKEDEGVEFCVGRFRNTRKG